MASRVGDKHGVNNESESITKMSAEDKGNTGIKEDSGDREFDLFLIDEALKKFPEEITLRKEQIDCVKNLVFLKRDVVALLPTGFGKSLIYQLLPELHKARNDSRRIVLVVTPLTAIMTEQAKSLKSLGIRAAVLGEDQPGQAQGPQGQDEMKLESITRGEVDIVFGSAETWLSNEWQKNLKDSNLGQLISEIAIDEVHTVIEW